MIHYSVHPRDNSQTVLDFCFFTENMGRHIGSKNLNKKFRRKNSQKLFDHAKQSATDAFKTASKKKKQTIQETIEATGDLIGNKIWAKITKG